MGSLVVVGVTCNDWEKENFGIRTAHHKDDLIDNVAIDENAPKVVRRKHKLRFKKRPSESEVRDRDRLRALKDNNGLPKSDENHLNHRTRTRTRSQSPSIRSSSVKHDDKIANSGVRKPSFAEFKQNFMEKSIMTNHKESSEDNRDNLALTTDNKDVSHIQKVNFQ